MSRYSKTVAAIVLTPTHQFIAEPAESARVVDLPIGDGSTLMGAPRTLYGNLRMVLDNAARLAAWPEITVLICWPGWSPDTDAAELLPWKTSQELAPGADWLTFRRSDIPTVVRVGLVHNIDAAKFQLWSPVVKAGSVPREDASVLMPDPRKVAERLSRYHQALGACWYITPGVSATNSVRALYNSPERGGQPYWGTRDKWYSGMTAAGAGDLQHWERDPNLTERVMQWVHGYDANRARLAAAGNAELAWGQIKHSDEARMFDPALAGFWQIEADHKVTAQAYGVSAPPLFDRDAIKDGYVWLTTPIMKALQDKGINPNVTATITEPDRAWGGTRRAHRLLRAWANRLDTAILRWSTVDPVLTGVLKASYKMLFGLMTKEGGGIFRPDWADSVLDLGRVNLIRRADRIHAETGQWPLRVHTDCMWYASDNPDPSDAFVLALGDKLGTFKPSTIPMAEWLDGRRR